MKLQSVLFEQLTELVAEHVAEDTAESLDGQEESVRGVYPSGTVESQASGGNDVVNVGMMLKVLSPRVEHAEKSDIGSQVLRLASQFDHRRGAGTEEQIVEVPLVLEDQSGEFVRQSEDDVEVRNGQQFGRARGQPFCARVALALRAVSIAA